MGDEMTLPSLFAMYEVATGRGQPVTIFKCFSTWSEKNGSSGPFWKSLDLVGQPGTKMLT